MAGVSPSPSSLPGTLGLVFSMPVMPYGHTGMSPHLPTYGPYSPVVSLMHLYGAYAGGASSSTFAQPAAPPSTVQYYTAPLSYGNTYTGGGAPALPFAPPSVSATGPAYGNMYDGHGVSSSLFPPSPVSSSGPVLFAHILTVKLSADNFLF
jgi:hypothetical protein